MRNIKKIIVISAAFSLIIMSGCTYNSVITDISEVSEIISEEISEAESTPVETPQYEEIIITETAPEANPEPEEVKEPESQETSSPQEPETKDEPVIIPVYVPVSSISLSTYDVTLSVGHKTMPWVTMSPANASDKGEIWVSSDTSVATVDKYGNIKGINAGSCTVTVTSADNPEVFATVNVTVNAEAECTYINGILIANKTYALPPSYAPGWDAEASDKLLEMFAAAKEEEGLYFKVLSGYRSYVDQTIIYNGYVARDGKAAADRYSARPGHSEHQTGLAFDLNKTVTSFGETPEGIWLRNNCHRFGFIIRYPKDKEHITGYMYEPWHVRYLGVETATAVYESGLCLEEYLGITSVYSY